MDDESVDLVLTDPPFNISQEVTINRNSQGKYKGNDISLDFGEWDHFETEAAYVAFTRQWLTECARVLVPGGYLVSFFDKRRISLIPDILEPMGFKMRDVVTWVKTNPVPQVRKVKFAQATEMAVVMSKPGPNKFQWTNGYHPNYKKAPIVGGYQRLKDKDGLTLHPTQKPEVIIRWLMDYLCEPGGMVLDPFAGTFTTAVEAVRSGRFYICIEQREQYYMAGMHRLEKVQPDLFKIDYKSNYYKEQHR